MYLDYRTLSFAASLVLTLCGLALLLLYAGHPRERALRLVAVSVLLGAGGVALAALRASIPDWIVIVFGNLLIVAGNGLLPPAVRALYDRPVRWRGILIWIGCAAATFAAMAALDTTFTQRVVLLAAFYTPLVFWTALEFLRREPELAQYERWAGPRLLCGAVFLLHGGYNLLRAVWQLQHGGEAAAMLTEQHLMHALSMIDALVIGVVFPFGIAMITGQKLQRRLDDLAHIDPLTRSLNRRAFEQYVAHALTTAGRDGHALSLILFDLDHFKQINDVHGHACGDFVLEKVAARLRELLRPTDALARLGGEEFAVLLPTTPPEAALRVADRLLAALRQTDFRYADTVLQVTASAGIAGAPQDGTDFAALYREADARLYVAKAGGRDRVAGADAPTPARSAD